MVKLLVGTSFRPFCLILKIHFFFCTIMALYFILCFLFCTRRDSANIFIAGTLFILDILFKLRFLFDITLGDLRICFSQHNTTCIKKCGTFWTFWCHYAEFLYRAAKINYIEAMSMQNKLLTAFCCPTSKINAVKMRTIRKMRRAMHANGTPHKE